MPAFCSHVFDMRHQRRPIPVTFLRVIAPTPSFRAPCEISPSKMLISKKSETARLLPHFGENLQCM